LAIDRYLVCRGKKASQSEAEENKIEVKREKSGNYFAGTPAVEGVVGIAVADIDPAVAGAPAHVDGVAVGSPGTGKSKRVDIKMLTRLPVVEKLQHHSLWSVHDVKAFALAVVSRLVFVLFVGLYSISAPNCIAVN
jgi:hypothetical protein